MSLTIFLFASALVFAADDPCLGLSADTQKACVSVPWSCSQTAPSKLPDQTSLALVYSSDGTNLDLSSFENLLAKAKTEAAEFDFSGCAEKFSAEAYSRIPKEPARTAVYNALSEKTAEYAAKAYRAGALAPVEPATEIGRLDENDWREIRYDLVVKCSAPDARFLDRRVLSEAISLSSLYRLGRDCRDRLAKDYARLLLKSQLDDSQCRVHWQICNQRQKSIGRALALLARAHLAGFDPFLSNSEILDACSLEKWIGSAGPLELMRDYVSFLNDAPACHRLTSAGQAVVVQSIPGLPIEPHYTLERLADRKNESGSSVASYRVYLRFEFERDAETYTEKARQCFELYRSRLRGPNGEHVELALFEGQKGVPAPPVHRIAIRKSGPIPQKERRSRMGAWLDTIDCPSVLHETFHVLGMIDEYSEEEIGAVEDSNGKHHHVDSGAEFADNDCRVRGPLDSVMNDQHIAVDTRSNLLYPAQFRLITQPGCVSANRLYYLCGYKANTTSRGHYGSESCARALPPDCYTEEWVRK